MNHYDSASKMYSTGKAIVVLAVALLLFACQVNESADEVHKLAQFDGEGSSFLAAENEAVAQIKKSIEEKRMKDGDGAARLLASFQKEMNAGSLSAEAYAKIKTQIDSAYLGIGTAIYRHELNLALMKYAVSVADRVRPALATRIKNGQKIPTEISTYLTETLMKDFEKEAVESIESDRSEIEFWMAEKEKWQLSWDSKDYDYVLPQKQRGRFLFDFDVAKKGGREAGARIEESLRNQIRKEIDSAIKGGVQSD